MAEPQLGVEELLEVRLVARVAAVQHDHLGLGLRLLEAVQQVEPVHVGQDQVDLGQFSG